MIFPSVKLTKGYFALYFEHLKLSCRLFNVGIKAPLYAPIKRQNVEKINLGTRILVRICEIRVSNG